MDQPKQLSSALSVKSTAIDKIKPYPDNPRHNQAAIESVAESIQAYGWRQPIVVDKQGVIIAGHTRYFAALYLQLRKVPVHVADMSSDDARAYRLADNKTGEWSTWDEDKLMAEAQALTENIPDIKVPGFDEDEWEALLAGFDVDVDNVDTTDSEVRDASEVESIVKPGDFWMLGDHRLICGDATNPETLTALMDSDTAECVFTSPPYSVGMDYGETSEDTIESLREMLPKLADVWNTVICEGGFAVVNFNDVLNGREHAGADGVCEYPMALEYWPVFRDAGWALWSRRVWCKNTSGVSSLHCITSNRAASNFEHVWTFKRDGAAVVSEQVSGEWASQSGWFDTSHIPHDRAVHGASMPIAVALRSIYIHSHKGAIVHEPFCGTGTTLIAAERLGRRCFATEISPSYCDVIIERWQDETGERAVKHDESTA